MKFGIFRRIIAMILVCTLVAGQVMIGSAYATDGIVLFDEFGNIIDNANQGSGGDGSVTPPVPSDPTTPVEPSTPVVDPSIPVNPSTPVDTDQLTQHRLKAGTVGVVGILFAFQDALHHIIGGDFCSLISGLAPQLGTHESRCVDIAGAMDAAGNLLMLVILLLAVLEYQHAGMTLGVGNAGEDDIFRTQITQTGDQSVNVGLVILGAVLHTGQEACLGDVGKQVVCTGAELLHLLHKGHVKSGIQLSVVGHCRVNYHQAALSSGSGNDVLHIFDLLCGTQITGVNTVEGQPLLLPVGTDTGHILRQITEREAGKAHGMGGQDCRGQHAGFNTAGRDNGQGNRQRALAHAGNILDGQNTLVAHIVYLFSNAARSAAL